jgi:metal-responsive CopG/Arc/MetJ family transcriptional regulator
MKTVTVKLPEELLCLLDRYAMNHKMHRSEAIREAIRKLLEEEDLNTEEE